MSEVEQMLADVGIRLAAGPEAPGVQVECARAARQLGDQARAIGLAPVDDDSAVPAVALELGRALVRLHGHDVAVVDPNGSWPRAAELRRAAAGARAGTFAWTWFRERLALLTPGPSDPGLAMNLLGEAVASCANPFGHVLLDLTGYDRRGEHVAASAQLDAVVLVARAGRTTRACLSRWLKEIPPPRCAGIVLTGCGPHPG